MQFSDNISWGGGGLLEYPRNADTRSRTHYSLRGGVCSIDRGATALAHYLCHGLRVGRRLTVKASCKVVPKQLLCFVSKCMSNTDRHTIPSSFTHIITTGKLSHKI